MKLAISVLILTKNEEQDLPYCLKSVTWSNDIHVFDSNSIDRTSEIATSMNAKVTQRAFDGYAKQRNAALQTLPFLHSWVLILDADERVPSESLKELMKAVETASPNVAAFRLIRRDFLWGRWLKHAQMTPYYTRLVRPAKVRYEREINEVLVADGEVRDLSVAFDHHPFSKGFSHWLDRHNRYSTMEAQRWLEENRNHIQFSFMSALFSKDFSERRYHQKGLFYKLPFRPFIKWLYMVIWRRSFMDGIPGITVATLQAIYEYFIELKAKELLLKEQNICP